MIAGISRQLRENSGVMLLAGTWLSEECGQPLEGSLKRLELGRAHAKIWRDDFISHVGMADCHIEKSPVP
jgi:hypothetical protein